MAEDYAGTLNLLDPTNATLAADIDDKIVVVKTAVKNSFPNVTGAVTKTHTQINALPDVGDAETVTADWTFSGNPVFSGNPTLSGTPAFSGAPTFKGLPFSGITAAEITSAGSITLQTNGSTLSCTRNSVGKYTVTHNLGHTNYIVFVVQRNTSGGNPDGRFALWTNKTTTKVDVELRDTAGGLYDVDFNIMILGA